MTPNMITLRDSRGRHLFAFSPLTDPDEVLLAVAWAHPHHRSMCDWPCPAVDGLYCLDCHAVAFEALTELRRRRDEATT